MVDNCDVLIKTLEGGFKKYQKRIGWVRFSRPDILNKEFM